jgi:hypothetical protein
MGSSGSVWGEGFFLVTAALLRRRRLVSTTAVIGSGSAFALVLLRGINDRSEF